jgi:hypothetical protein
MTRLEFPIFKNKAKAKWLGVSDQQAQVVRGPVQFFGYCCGHGCKRITGHVYDNAGTSRIEYDPVTQCVVWVPSAPRGTTFKGAVKVQSAKAARKIKRHANAAGQTRLHV